MTKGPCDPIAFSSLLARQYCKDSGSLFDTVASNRIRVGDHQVPIMTKGPCDPIAFSSLLARHAIL